MRSLDVFAQAKLDKIEAANLRRAFVTTGRGDFPYVVRDGRRLLSFSCNDYLGLSQHPAVKAAAMKAIEAHGTGAGASRLVTGNHTLYAALESRLAAAKHTEAACVFGSGYLANIGLLGVLAGPEDLIVIDELAHACLNAGAHLTRAQVVRFRHNDLAHAAALLESRRKAHQHTLVVTETVFSMDGDIAPIAALAELCERHDAWLVTDDAHGFCTLPHAEAHVPIQMGTLSKALGTYGGYLCASAAVIGLVVTRARSLIYSTGLPAACIAAALAGLDIIAAEPQRSAAPLAKARRFTDALGLPLAQSPIVPVVLGPPEAALAASEQLAEAGFLVSAIRPPTVPDGTARLRLTFSYAHSDGEIDRLADAVRTILAFREQRQPCQACS